ncbi:psm1 [Symbiodinium natans]|uniref:Psm1 protein n=1 Tax=Symbiodinium natans TaxID=878477 RepID=A0A812L855_9DINO|nr:psm1 [Symbiodinium natans]
MSQNSPARVEKLVIQNFKSYAGRHEIGPFDKFTCIIGPNGSGKSNIMDAISFCLGIKTKHLRGERLKDLVYRREDETVDANPRSAEVTMAFRSSKGVMMYFGRFVTSRGEGIYRYGGEKVPMSPVSYEVYSQKLANENIFVRARSFLVFQGDVMQMARRQGAELTATLEALSGSELLKDKYSKLSKELEISQEKARLHFQHRREAENTLALLASQRAEVKRYQDLKAQRDALIVEAALFRLYSADREAAQNIEVSSGLRTEVAEAEAELRKRRKAIEEADAQRQKFDEEFREAQNEHFAMRTAMEQQKPEIASCRKQAAHWSIKEREVQAKIEQEELHIKGLEDAWNQALSRRTAAEEELAKIRAREVESAVKLTAAQRREYDQAVLKTEQLNLKARDKLMQAEDKLQKLLKELSSCKEDMQEREDKRNKLNAKMEDLQREKGDIEIGLETSRVEIEETRRQRTKLESDVKTYETFRSSLLEERQSLQFEVDSVKARRDQLELLEGRQRVADELRGRFPELVLGRISELLLPTQKKYDLPLQMALGAMSDAFVVKDAAAARRCVQHLKESRIAAETFLPLDRMQEDRQVTSLSSLTERHPGRRLATACVQHNEKFLHRQEAWRETAPAAIDRTVTFLLQGVIITDTLDQAKQTSYVDAKKKSLMPRVVTLDGEVIAPNGNMSVKALPAHRVEFGGHEQLHQLREKESKLDQVTKDLATLEEESERKAKEVQVLSDEVARKEIELVSVERLGREIASLREHSDPE